MKFFRPTFRIILALLLTSLAAVQSLSADKATPKTLGDLFWVWATPDRDEQGEHNYATFAQAPAAQKAKLLGTPNVIMAGSGLPDDAQLADDFTKAVADCSRVIWEISPDGQREVKPPFVYANRAERISKLVQKYPNVEGVLLDDMTSVGIDGGFEPGHVRDIRKLLDAKCPQVKIWGVLYTMNFGRPQVEQIVKETDVISLWVWHARDLADLEKHVAHCEKTFPGKPIVLGLYLRDYGDNRPMTKAQMELQCETARKLAHAGRIKGIVFLTIDNDEEIVAWTADWIKRVGGEPLGSPTAAKQADVPVRLVSQETDKAAEAKPLELRLGDGGDWHFLGGSGPWTESGEGVINPPNEPNLHSRAFFTKAAFADFDAEFEFNGSYRETGTGAAGMILRAADANHCYILYFPWGGQQLRAKHFWAQLLKVDGDGYLRSLKSVWVPGVPSETDRWYKIRVAAKGPAIDVWVDGFKALSISDESFKSGAVGLTGYGWYAFRNVKINGQSSPPVDWDRKQTIPGHNFTVGLSSAEMPSGCIAPNGDVLLAAGNQLVRSKDKGRTWQKPETLPEKLGKITDYGNTMYRTAGGRLIVQKWIDRAETKKDVPAVEISESSDNGLTWSDPVAAQVGGGWPGIPSVLVPYGPILETADGTMLRFVYGSAREETIFPNVATWSAVHCRAFAIRSADGGKTWSGPIEIDQPSWVGQPRGTIAGSLDLTEPTGVAIGNKIMVLVRPVYSQYMWQCWSHDAGASWDSAARATFPGYAQSMIRTASGAIVCAHRFPQYSINISRDGGLNWDEGTIIDYPVWAMGCIVEVEPDMLLCTYMNATREAPLLAQLVRVTENGIEPVVNAAVK